MEHVLLKKPALKKKLVLPEGATIAAPQTEAPLWESTLTETLGIRKFIEMSILDTRQQLEQAARQRLPKRKFDEQKLSALIITAWLTSALATVDEMLQEAATKSKTGLAEQKRQEENGD